jgi:hypothetical protein
MKMTSKAVLMSLCIGGSAMIAPAVASAGIGIDVNIAPPVAQVEVMPEPRAGYVWAPGYWDYRGGSHVWVGGRWRGERRGYHWAPDRWEQRGSQWHHNAGHWER